MTPIVPLRARYYTAHGWEIPTDEDPPLAVTDLACLSYTGSPPTEAVLSWTIPADQPIGDAAFYAVAAWACTDGTALDWPGWDNATMLGTYAAYGDPAGSTKTVTVTPGDPSPGNCWLFCVRSQDGDTHISDESNIVLAQEGEVPVIVASQRIGVAPGGLSVGDFTLLANAPIADYRLNVYLKFIQLNSDSTYPNYFYALYDGATQGSGDCIVPMWNTASYTSAAIPADSDYAIWEGSASFRNATISDIKFGFGGTTPTGTDNSNIYLVLERLPDAGTPADIFTLYAMPAGSGSVTTDPNQVLFALNDEVELTAVDGGGTFSAWSGDVPSGHETDNPLTITMDGPKSLTATFIGGD